MLYVKVSKIEINEELRVTIDKVDETYPLSINQGNTHIAMDKEKAEELYQKLNFALQELDRLNIK